MEEGLKHDLKYILRVFCPAGIDFLQQSQYYENCRPLGWRLIPTSEAMEDRDEVVYESLSCSKPLLYFHWLNDD